MSTGWCLRGSCFGIAPGVRGGTCRTGSVRGRRCGVVITGAVVTAWDKIFTVLQTEADAPGGLNWVVSADSTARLFRTDKPTSCCA